MLTNDLSDLSVSMRGEIDYEREREPRSLANEKHDDGEGSRQPIASFLFDAGAAAAAAVAAAAGDLSFGRRRTIFRACYFAARPTDGV